MSTRNKRKSTEIICEQCGIKFMKETYELTRFKNHFCSHKCSTDYNTAIGTFQTSCHNCGKTITKMLKDLRNSKSGKLFCSSSCSASFSNTERKRVRRSKIETAFFEKLCSIFPDIDILPNDKIMLDGLEVDIAIPSLKLAIEWNGVIHFKPIYGDEGLRKAQTNDAKKKQLSNEKDINLIVIADLDSKQTTLNRALDEVKAIINDLLTG